MPVELYPMQGHDDDTPLPPLDLDAQEVLLREYRGIQDIFKDLLPRFRFGPAADAPPTVRERVTFCGLLEHHVRTLNDALGYQGDLAREMDERSAALRRANAQIRELEEKVAAARGAAGTAGLFELFQSMSQGFQRYLKTAGFGLVYDTPRDGAGPGGGFAAYFNRLAYVATFWPHLSESMKIATRHPVTQEEQWTEFIGRRSEEMDLWGEHGRDYDVLDTPKSRAWIAAYLQARYPSLTIDEIRVQRRSIRRGSDHEHVEILRSITITVHDIAELLQRAEH